MALEREPKPVAKDPKPVARAEIKLSQKERLRIAKDLGLERDELDSVPETLHIERYTEKEIARQDIAAFAGQRLEFGRIPGGILIPV